MPNLIQPEDDGSIRIEFLVSLPLDLINAMCFTSLAGQLEGLPEWPRRTYDALDPALRAELDLFFGFPGAEWGMLGALTDLLFLHREAWGSVDALLDFIRRLPPGGDDYDDSESPTVPASFLMSPEFGIQGLALLYAHRGFTGNEPTRGRDRIAKAAAAAGRNVKEALALFDDPEQLRARLLRLIRRFYDEHYRPDEERRVTCMERTAAARNPRPVRDVDGLLRELTHRNVSCIKEEAADYTHHLFVPSVDVGPYSSCADFPPYHGLFYECEPQYTGVGSEDYDAQRMALVYRALADEQRLRILRELRDGELYANEIVARTGIHQSVVSRHLSFMKAVGLVVARRQNNMKFFSLNTEMRDELARAVEMVMPATRERPAPATAGARGRRRGHVE